MPNGEDQPKNRWGDRPQEPIHDPTDPKENKGKAVLWGVLVVLAVGLAALSVWCSGAMGDFSRLHELSKEKIQFDPVIRRYIGEVEVFEFSFEKTSKQKEYNMVFEIRGTRGRGDVFANVEEQASPDTEPTVRVVNGKLRLETGGEYALTPQ